MKTLPMPTKSDEFNSADMEMPDEMPELNMPVRRKLPSGIASNVKQHVLLVCDHSSSMAGSKIVELNMAREALVTELAAPENKDGFRVSVIDFNDKAERLNFAEPAETLNTIPSVAGGGTSFEAALRETLDAVRDFAAKPNDEGWNYLRPVILFLSDGQSSVSDHLLMEIQEEAQIIAIAYGTDANQSTLGRISSDGTVQVVGTDGDELRKFLAAVGQTMSEALQGSRT